MRTHRVVSNPVVSVLLWVAVAVMGCAGDPAGTTAPGADGDVWVDRADGEIADGQETTPAWEPPPVAPEVAPERLEDLPWRVLYVGNKPDPVIDAIEAGTFTWPEAGIIDGYWWKDEGPDESGAFTPPSYGLLMYAVTRVETETPRGVIARADAMSRVMTLSGARQPGDPYAHQQHRVALRTESGESLVVFQAYGGSRTPSGELWLTDDEIWMNLDDITRPDLMAGETATQVIGLPVLNLTDAPALDVRARVIGNEYLEDTSLSYPAIGTLSATQVAFELRPRAGLEAGVEVPITLRVESPSLQWSYERTLTVTSVSADPAEQPTVRRSFISDTDGSAQYYGLLRATEADGGDGRALVLSLHGAGVEGIGQAGSYAPKTDTVLVAPTNRRRFGFDWELWGRLNALESLAHARSTHAVDPTRVYLTGHSMGGHGTWQLGTLFPDLFAVVGPSAGWISFATYGGDPFPTGPFGWARHASDTLRYVDNLAQRAVYIIHGSADDNVPISQAYTMHEALQSVTDDLQFHIEPGAGHWWNGDAGPGTDCVDWPPLFETMEDRRLDPLELDFSFRSPGPWVNPRHGWLTILSAASPAYDVTASSSHVDGTVTLTTSNVRSMQIEGESLMDQGVHTILVDGATYEVQDDTIEVGPQTGKRPEVYGPFTQVFFKPFCYVFPESGPDVYRRYADYMLSVWTIIGNGHACVVPDSAVDEALRASRNLIFLGPAAGAPTPTEDMLVSWNSSHITVAGGSWTDAVLAMVLPDGDGLAAIITATEGYERNLFRLQPFTSRFVVPDYLVFRDGGAVAVGFFDGEWTFDPDLSTIAP